MTHNNQSEKIKRIASARIAAGALIVIVIFASTLSAAEVGDMRDDRGLYLGARVGGSTLHLEEIAGAPLVIKDEGGGIQLYLGWQFSGVFALELSAAVAGHETSIPGTDVGASSLQVLGVYRFAEGSRFRPYLKGGFGAYGIGLVDAPGNEQIQGGGVAFGGGFDVFLSSHFALGLDLTHNIIEYESVDLNVGGVPTVTNLEEESSMTTFGLSLAVYF